MYCLHRRNSKTSLTRHQLGYSAPTYHGLATTIFITLSQGKIYFHKVIVGGPGKE